MEKVEGFRIERIDTDVSASQPSDKDFEAMAGLMLDLLHWWEYHDGKWIDLCKKDEECQKQPHAQPS